MQPYCQRCQRIAPDFRLLACPYCKSPFRPTDSGTSDQYSDAERKIDLNQYARTEMQLAREEMRERLASDFKGYRSEFQRKFWILGSMTVLSIIGLGIQYFQYERRVGQYLTDQEKKTRVRVDDTLASAVRDVQVETQKALSGAVESVRKSVNIRLNEEFQTPRIQQTVSDAAAAQSKTLMDQRITPEVRRIRDQTAADLRKFQDFLHGYETNYKTDFDKLSKTTGASEALVQSLREQIEIISLRNRVAELGDAAITDGDRSSFDVLNNVADDPAQTAEARKLNFSEALQVKKFWIGINRIKAQQFTWRGSDGKPMEENQLSTCDLLRELQNSGIWQVRAKAAQLLSDHHEVGVPEGLLAAIKSDRNLHVVADAVHSFGSVTGFQSPDVFGQPFIENWWRDHNQDVSKSLAKLNCGAPKH